MRVVARTSRNTGVSTGPLVLAIGGLLYLAAMAIAVVATFIVAGVMLAVGEVRRWRSARVG